MSETDKPTGRLSSMARNGCGGPPAKARRVGAFCGDRLLARLRLLRWTASRSEDEDGARCDEHCRCAHPPVTARRVASGRWTRTPSSRASRGARAVPRAFLGMRRLGLTRRGAQQAQWSSATKVAPPAGCCTAARSEPGRLAGRLPPRSSTWPADAKGTADASNRRRTSSARCAAGHVHGVSRALHQRKADDRRRHTSSSRRRQARRPRHGRRRPFFKPRKSCRDCLCCVGGGALSRIPPT